MQGSQWEGKEVTPFSTHNLRQQDYLRRKDSGQKNAYPMRPSNQGSASMKYWRSLT